MLQLANNAYIDNYISEEFKANNYYTVLNDNQSISN